MPESIKNDKCKIKKIKKSYKTFSTNIINIKRKIYWTIKMILKLLAPSYRAVKQNDTPPPDFSPKALSDKKIKERNAG